MIATQTIPILTEMEKVRFWSKVERKSDGECWPWVGALTKRGYGSVKIQGGSFMPHRVSFAMDAGDPATQVVCHKCDNPRCVNPSHLFLGTQQDNVKDAISKGRFFIPSGSKGDKNPSRKLTSFDVPVIRGMKSSGVSTPFLAELFKVSQSTINRVISKELWPHI